MKKNIFKLLCLSTLAGLTLTGCTSLLPQGDPGNPNSGASQTHTQVTPDQGQENEEVDLVNDAVNDSLEKLAEKLNQPMFAFNADYKLTNELYGTSSTKQTIIDARTGDVINQSGRDNLTYSQIGKTIYSGNGQIDNLYYLASKNNAEDRMSNDTSFIGDVETQVSVNGKNNASYEKYRVEENQYYYSTTNDNNSWQTLDNANNKIGNEIGANLDRLYLTASSVEYDASFETMTQFLLLLSQINHTSLQQADIIHLIDATVKLISKDYSANDYLDMLLTRYLFIDSSTLQQKDRTMMTTILQAAQNINIDDVLVVTENSNVITATLDYNKVKSVLSALSGAITGLNAYLENGNINTGSSTNLQDFSEMFTHVPSTLNFIRKFTLVNDVISSYDFTLQIDGFSLPNMLVNTDYNYDGNYRYITESSTTLNSVDIQAKINFSY